MSDLYENLLKATDNTNDITTEKYGVITKINGTLCSVKEYDSELEHSNVPIVNGAKLEIGDKVIIGFLNNSIYDTVCYGVLDRQIETNWEDIKDKPTTFPPTPHNHISSEITDLINTIYPVGSIYMSVNSTSPATLFGGTWVQLTDTFLYASNTADTNSTTATGGESTHTLIESELPYIEGTFPHIAYGQNKVSGHTVYTDGNVSNREGSASTTSNTHIYKFSFGNGQAHNNMPPYMKVFMWKRTA